MAKARQIVKRRKAVRNVRKITQTMQLIATARFQKCLTRASATKPYTQKITEMIGTLASTASVEHRLFQPNASTARGMLIVLTANRGLCGSYNANVLRVAVERYRQLRDQGAAPEVFIVGKRGAGFLRFLGFTPNESILDIDDKVDYLRIAEIGERLMRRYAAGELARVEVAYTRFVSTSTQKAELVQLLPIEPPKAAPSADAAGKQGPRIDFEFSPEPALLLARLIPEAVKIRLFQYFNDSIVSEQVSRMIAMKAATDAAADTIKNLSRAYNRARQSQITLELADIVGGAEAVK